MERCGEAEWPWVWKITGKQPDDKTLTIKEMPRNVNEAQGGGERGRREVSAVELSLASLRTGRFNSGMSSPHPFLDDRFPIAWSRLQPAALGPDISLALDEAQGRLDSLAEWDGVSPLTFENTLIALDQSTEKLTDAWGLVELLQSVRDQPAHRAAFNEMLPKVTEFYARIPLNEALWRRLNAYAETPEARQLSGARKRLLDETIAQFQLSGADLSPEKKQRFEAVQAELASLTQKYSENVLDATNAWDLIIEDPVRLAGLPASALAVLRKEAVAKGLGTDEKPVWRITLKQPAFFPVLEYAEDDDLRREVWEASSALCRGGEFDNSGLVWQILALRKEKAALLGKADFAELVLERRMARDGKAALKFVGDLRDRTAEAFARENKELEDYRAQVTGAMPEPFQPWQVSYWAEKRRRAEFDFDEEDLRPYFPVDGVLAGLFQLAEQLFRVRVVARTTAFIEPGTEPEKPLPEGVVEVWHPEVKCYDLIDQATEELLGSFFTDWHPRESKRGGAWMSRLRTGSPPWESHPREPHLGLIAGNMTPATSNRPALLSHSEVETVFHEFGHLIHHLLGDVDIKSLNGIAVVWDFVELPSQIMENFCWSRKSLDLFARHYETGEVIPEELFQKMIAARNYRAASAQMRQLSFGKLDLELHVNYDRWKGRDLDELGTELLEGYLMPLKTRPPSMTRRFTHLFADPTGYAAGYYSYKWAEVLDADAFTRFEAAGVICPQVGSEFRAKVLSRGNADDPANLFRDFMGRDPDLNALLIRNGLLS